MIHSSLPIEAPNQKIDGWWTSSCTDRSIILVYKRCWI